MDRIYREIARDAALAAGALLAHLVLLYQRDSVQVAGDGAADGPALDDLARRTPLLTALWAGAVPPAALSVLEGREEHAIAPTGGLLGELLAARGQSPWSVFLQVGEPGQIVLLHLVFRAAPPPGALGGLEAIGRLVAGRLAAVGLRQEATRDRLAVSDLRQAKETLAGLQIAGTLLMIETDEGSILGAVSRELARLGLHSGVLLDVPDGSAEGPVLRWRFASLPAALRQALERVMERSLESARLTPESAPLLFQGLAEERTLVAARPRAMARDLLGGATAGQLRALSRLLGPIRIVLAPLRREGRTIGVLVVLAPRLRPGDLEAIEAFSSQASIALEKARLVQALREERSRLNAEVDRRTRDLRLAVEALQETDRRKDNFLANVSHELRTPLVTVLGWAELLAGEKLGALLPRQRQAAQVIRTSGRRLEAFIAELLDFSRHELTRDRLSRQAVEVGEVLSQVVVAMAPRFAERGVRLRGRAAPGLPRLWIDRERVLQVLVNLLANAERHSAEGGRVRLAAARGPGASVLLSVADRGEGIAEEHLPRIFDRLYQVRDAAAQKDRGSGLGLGLAIARSIVEAHGGQISVRSRVGRGTAFRFTLPTVEAAESG
jgi:signal transduction histidine kinase